MHQLVGIALREHVPMLEDVVDQRLQRSELGEDNRDFLMDAGVVAHDLVVDDGVGHAMPTMHCTSMAHTGT